MKKLKLHGFNNLTKSLSFCIYDICYAKTAEERDGYIAYIDELYNANRLTEILSETCSIIGANILNIARQDYRPQGASVTILVSEEPVDPKLIDKTEHPDHCQKRSLPISIKVIFAYIPTRKVILKVVYVPSAPILKSLPAA